MTCFVSLFAHARRMTVKSALFVGVFSFAASSITVLSVPVAYAAAPLCNGLSATIYVEAGLIVGGPDNGNVFSGTLNGSNGADVIVGTSGDETIDAGSGDDTVCALGGADDVETGNGDDWIDGGDGNNTIDAGSGADNVTTGSGNDDIETGSGDDTVNSGGGHDVIAVSSGTNNVNAGTGNDMITAGNGNDTVNGGDGTDFCDAGGGTNTVTNCELSSGGAVVIVQDTVPDDGQDFAFTGSLATFNLDDDTDGTLSNEKVSLQSAGMFSVVETQVTGWNLQSITCFDVDGGTTVNVGTFTATIDLDAGEVVTCVYSNEDVASAAAEEEEGGGRQSTRFRKQNFIHFLIGIGNAGFGSVGIPGSSFGGPGPGGETGEYTQEQLTAMCAARDSITLLAMFDVIDFMAENYAHIYDLPEEVAADILKNGTGCDAINTAKAEEARLLAQAQAKAEADKLAAELAAIEARKPKPIVFNVGEDGYPVSSDPIWNACIRHIQLFVEGQHKPVTCNRYHEGHTWEHPDMLISFNWSDTMMKRIRVRGETVVTNIVESPQYLVTTHEVKNHLISKLTIPSLMYFVDRALGLTNFSKFIATDSPVDTTVLSEQEVESVD